MRHIEEYKLWEYLEDEMPAEETEYVKEHLNICDKCSLELKQLIDDLGKFDTLQPAEPDKVFWAAYLPRLKQRMEDRKSSGGYIYQWMSAFASAAAVVIFTLMLTGGFEAERVPMFYEEWAANNLYHNYPSDIDANAVDNIFWSMLDEEEQELWLEYNYDYTESLENLSDEEWNELHKRVMQTPVL